MIAVILSASGLIATALWAICSASSLPEPINPARPATTFNGVPSSWAMPEASRPTVFRRSAWRSCSRAVIRAAVSCRSLVLRFGQACAHGVEVLGQFRQFIAGTKVYGPFQVPLADPPGLGDQLLQRPTHHANPEQYGQQPADQDHAADSSAVRWMISRSLASNSVTGRVNSSPPLRSAARATGQ